MLEARRRSQERAPDLGGIANLEGSTLATPTEPLEVSDEALREAASWAGNTPVGPEELGRREDRNGVRRRGKLPCR